MKVGRQPVDAALRIGRDAGADEEELRAELLQKVKLALRAVEGALRFAAGMPSKSRNGWQVAIARPRSSHMRFTSAGEPAKAIRSFSKISTVRKPAAAMASSFSGSTPERQTVAIDVFMA